MVQSRSDLSREAIQQGLAELVGQGQVCVDAEKLKSSSRPVQEVHGRTRYLRGPSRRGGVGEVRGRGGEGAPLRERPPDQRVPGPV